MAHYIASQKGNFEEKTSAFSWSPGMGEENMAKYEGGEEGEVKVSMGKWQYSLPDMASPQSCDQKGRDRPRPDVCSVDTQGKGNPFM
jgi:hypothetical protein